MYIKPTIFIGIGTSGKLMLNEIQKHLMQIFTGLYEPLCKHFAMILILQEEENDVSTDGLHDENSLLIKIIYTPENSSLPFQTLLPSITEALRYSNIPIDRTWEELGIRFSILRRIVLLGSAGAILGGTAIRYIGKQLAVFLERNDFHGIQLECVLMLSGLHLSLFPETDQDTVHAITYATLWELGTGIYYPVENLTPFSHCWLLDMPAEKGLAPTNDPHQFLGAIGRGFVRLLTIPTETDYNARTVDHRFSTFAYKDYSWESPKVGEFLNQYLAFHTTEDADRRSDTYSIYAQEAAIALLSRISKKIEEKVNAAITRDLQVELVQPDASDTLEVYWDKCLVKLSGLSADRKKIFEDEIHDLWIDLSQRKEEGSDDKLEGTWTIAGIKTGLETIFSAPEDSSNKSIEGAIAELEQKLSEAGPTFDYALYKDQLKENFEDYLWSLAPDKQTFRQRITRFFSTLFNRKPQQERKNRLNKANQFRVLLYEVNQQIRENEHALSERLGDNYRLELWKIVRDKIQKNISYLELLEPTEKVDDPIRVYFQQQQPFFESSIFDRKKDYDQFLAKVYPLLNQSVEEVNLHEFTFFSLIDLEAVVDKRITNFSNSLNETSPDLHPISLLQSGQLTKEMMLNRLYRFMDDIKLWVYINLSDTTPQNNHTYTSRTIASKPNDPKREEMYLLLDAASHPVRSLWEQLDWMRFKPYELPHSSDRFCLMKITHHITPSDIARQTPLNWAYTQYSNKNELHAPDFDYQNKFIPPLFPTITAHEFFESGIRLWLLAWYLEVLYREEIGGESHFCYNNNDGQKIMLGISDTLLWEKLMNNSPTATMIHHKVLAKRTNFMAAHHKEDFRQFLIQKQVQQVFWRGWEELTKEYF